jgi:hypothetical protein
MSAVRAAAAQMSLAEREMLRFAEQHGHALALKDLPFLGACIKQVREGYPLRSDQLARLSRMRGKFGPKYRRHTDPIDCDWGGAA